MPIAPEIKVSIIEDSIDLCKTLNVLINATPGLQCMSIHFNGKSAISALSQNPVDVVLVDLGLPDVSGITCIEMIKEATKETQFLVFTIKDQDEEVFGALKAGASGYLLKSSSPFEIIDAIKELYKGGSPMSTAVARKVVNYFQSERQRNSKIEDLLTSREKEVLELLAIGKYYKEIGQDLHISIETVKSHCHNIYEKLHVSSKTEAINKYYGH